MVFAEWYETKVEPVRPNGIDYGIDAVGGDETLVYSMGWLID